MIHCANVRSSRAGCDLSRRPSTVADPDDGLEDRLSDGRSLKGDGVNGGSGSSRGEIHALKDAKTETKENEGVG